MALVDDLVSALLLASAAFFVALAAGLLVRYRRVSQRITESSDLGRDLWQALEQRTKKQDERILDIMGRLEVIQARVLAAAAAQTVAPPLAQPVTAPQPPREAVPDVIPPAAALQPPESREGPQESQGSQPHALDTRLDETQLRVIALLSESPKNTRQLTDAIGLSREHTARLMKELFEAGFVSRSDATKPFVYQLTDQGRRRLTEGPG